MIKVNSLDFLNKTNFESDICDSQENILARKGDTITPELLLKLYYKNIFISEQVQEETITAKEAKTIAPPEFDLEKNAFDNEENIQPPEFAIDEIQTPTNDSQVPEFELGDETQPTKTLYAFNEPADETSQKNPQSADFDMETGKSSENVPVPIIDLSNELTDDAKIPKQPEFDFSEEDASSKKPFATDIDEIENNKQKGPSLAEFNLDEDPKESKKGPVASEFTIDDDDDKKSNSNRISNNAQLQEKEIIEEKPPEPKFLEFSETQAERISNISVKLGKMFDYNNEEINKLKQAAYYCNVGLQKFKEEDLHTKDFEKRKAYAGYKMATEELNLPDDIAETIKNHTEDYETINFPLNTQIPRKHIIGIVSYYENMLMRNKTKQETIDKMLQLGGNKFNIYVLHKFIRIMREEND